MASIARRLRHTYLFISGLIIILMALVAVVISEDLESTMMELDFASERDFFLQQWEPGDAVAHWESSMIKAYYLPTSVPTSVELPVIFQKIGHRASGEIEHEGHAYLIEVIPAESGILYLAKDITRIEDREGLFAGVIATTALLLVGVSFLLSYVESRRLVKPLKQLSEDIQAIPIGPKMPRLTDHFRDSELTHIATTFNGFLQELEFFVRREKTLIGLASHELRTPIAVISGALDILEERNRLDPADAQTLARVRSACSEMQQNVTALLALSRRKETIDLSSDIDLPELIEEVIEDLSSAYPVLERVELDIPQRVSAKGDPGLVKMLLRNLIQNALQHTRGSVLIRLQPDNVAVIDEGKTDQVGVQLGQIRELSPDADAQSLGGLGLYIAQTICDRQGWTLGTQTESATHRIVIHFA